MRALDLFCGAGGASVGLHRAGFEVVGVDITPQPHYPFEFRLGDALEADLSGFDLVWASPPCQEYTKASKQWRANGKQYPDLISQVRTMLKSNNKPWVIENVPGSPLINAILLTGSMFGMRIHRRRYFETSFPVPFVLEPQQNKPIKMGRPITEGDVVQPVGHFSGVKYVADEMGLPWMTQSELSQAIPPAYSQFISKFALVDLPFAMNGSSNDFRRP